MISSTLVESGGGGAQGTLANGYAQVTADQGAITAFTDLAGLSVNVNVGAGRRIKITAQVIMVSNTNGDLMGLRIVDASGPTTLTEATEEMGSNLGAGQGMTLTAIAVVTGASGAKTYKLQGGREAGTGTLTMHAAATFPAFILVEDIGS